MKPGYTILAIATLISVASCQSVETDKAKNHSAYSGKVSLREEIIGHRFVYHIGTGSGVVTYRPTYLTAESNGYKIVGSLRISGDRICTRFGKIRDAREECFSVTRTATGYKTSHGGTLRPL